MSRGSPVNRKALIHDLTLMLLYLTSWEEKVPGGSVQRAWKSYDRATIDTLAKEGLLSTSKRSKSAHLTPEACRQAEVLVTLFDITLEDVQNEIRKHMGELDGPMRAFVFRVELDLEGVATCWREIAVPANFTFDLLHQVIQSAFLWWGYHLYDFKLRSKGKDLFITNPVQGGVDAMFGPWDSDRREMVDARDLTLDQVFPRTRKASYSYDYGDGWEHSIAFVRTEENYAGELPTCLDGEGDAPPEDVGGAGGFESFLSVMEDPENPDNDDLAAWAESQGFTPYTLEAVNKRMRDWGTGELFDEWDRLHGIEQ